MSYYCKSNLVSSIPHVVSKRCVCKARCTIAIEKGQKDCLHWWQTKISSVTTSFLMTTCIICYDFPTFSFEAQPIELLSTHLQCYNVMDREPSDFFRIIIIITVIIVHWTSNWYTRKHAASLLLMLLRTVFEAFRNPLPVLCKPLHGHASQLRSKMPRERHFRNLMYAPHPHHPNATLQSHRQGREHV
jgi:hypothetical protein